MNTKRWTLGMMMIAGALAGLSGCVPIVPPPGDPCAGVTCDDGDLCTTDECVNGECINLMIAIDCPEGSTCDPDTGTCVEEAPSEPQGFLNASVARGGSLYDKWWVVAGVDEPTDDHPRWSMQDTNQREGADTWRCKECHGWDYKGVDGAYGSGSHMTGFRGIFGTTLSAQDVFDKIKDGHGLGTAGLSDDDIWDLAKFVLEGQIDTDDIIDADNAFIGDVDNGQTLYDGGIGGNPSCSTAGCHGPDGLGIEFHEDEFLGDLARGNPWELQHKVRFGNPGTLMPAAWDVDATNDDVADVGAYSQTLP